jgi:TPR repeat protein
MRVLTPSQVLARVQLQWLFWLYVVIPLGIVILIGRFFYQHIEWHMRGEKSACRHGDVAACVTVGEAYVERSQTSKYKDDAVAEEYLDRACRLGAATACNRLGWVYTNTDDDTYDAGKALAAWDKACAGGVASGCAAAGDWLWIQRDDSKGALAYHQKGCELHDLDACFGLAIQLYNGDGVERDQARGRELLANACAAGHAQACDEASKIDRVR